MKNKIKLLIVDDEIEFLDSITERLEQRGLEVAKATDADSAIALAQRQKFDLALLDLRIPGTDGKELLEKLKQEHKFLEIIMLTGYGTIDSAFECSKLGAFGYLSKPFDIDHLLQVLKEAFQHRMQQKFASDHARAQKLADLAIGASPLGILRAMKEIDDDET